MGSRDRIIGVLISRLYNCHESSASLADLLKSEGLCISCHEYTGECECPCCIECSEIQPFCTCDEFHTGDTEDEDEGDDDEKKEEASESKGAKS